ncbi:MAG TPA: cytochrome P450, partial [Erythrobacter sp.]|nr:cytochrome P450 [Erythrobacter sp.]
TAVICKMLGIRFRAEFQQWVEDAVYRRISDPKAADAANVKIYDYFRKRLAKRRASPGDDLVSLVL